jgi:hypothetical protein
MCLQLHAKFCLFPQFTKLTLNNNHEPDDKNHKDRIDTSVDVTTGFDIPLLTNTGWHWKVKTMYTEEVGWENEGTEKKKEKGRDDK